MTTDNAGTSARIDPSAPLTKRVRIGPRIGRNPSGTEAAHRGHADHARSKADICVVRNGDRIESIKVICSCGEEININCMYQENQ